MKVGSSSLAIMIKYLVDIHHGFVMSKGRKKGAGTTRHCRICHSPMLSEKHYCRLTNLFEVRDLKLVYYYRENRDPAISLSMNAYIIKKEIQADGTEKEDGSSIAYGLAGIETSDFLRSAFRTILLEISCARRKNIQLIIHKESNVRKIVLPVRAALKVEDIFRPWAILSLVPDSGIPCQNIRPIDLVSDKESLFANCDVVSLMNKGRV